MSSTGHEATKFAFSGNEVDFVLSPPVILNDLPADFYALKFSPPRGLYLSKIDPFTMPEKIYGDLAKRADRIIKTFDDRKGGTGLLLSGEKGSGKTLLGKKVALDLMARGMPVIVINMPVSGDDFGIFLQRINKPVTLFFDEFEKVYNAEHGQQEGLLTILDGVYPVRYMAIMTTNDAGRVSDPLLNRPGRVFYKIDYTGLEFSFIRDYATEKLVNKEHLDDLLRLAAVTTLNFDQLQALIEEMNRFDEPVRDAVQFLNVSIDRESVSTKVLSLTDAQGNHINKDDLHTEYFHGDLTSSSNADDDDDDYDQNDLHFVYFRPNTEKWTWTQFYEDHQKRAHEETNYETNSYYTIRNIIGSYTMGESDREKEMRNIPMLVTIKRECLKIEPRANGELVISDSESGAKVVMRRTQKSYHKTW